MTRAIAPILLLAVLVSGCSPSAPIPRPLPAAEREIGHLSTDGATLSATFGDQTMRIEMGSLATELSSGATASPLTVSDPAEGDLGAVEQATVTDHEASWTLSSGLTVSVSMKTHAGSVAVRVTPTTTGPDRIIWPITGTDESVNSIEYANGSGQRVPIRDPFWVSPESGLSSSPRALAGDLTLPVWGITGTGGDVGTAMYTETDIGSALEFRIGDGVVQAAATHAFTPDGPDYAVTFTPNGGSAIAAALAYRDHLIDTGGLTTLTEKIAANPNVAELIGAPHGYVWGTGRAPDALAALKSAGLDRFWLGYDSDSDPPAAEFVAAADGFLVGPYDSWANAQPANESDAPTSVWPGDLFPDGCVLDQAGAPVTGFGGRGCYLSSAALDAAQRRDDVISQRVADFTANGAISYFLDVDAAGQLFHDYSAEHSQTMAEDRSLRLQRMASLAAGHYSGGAPLVLGSESAGAWANPAIAFSHGSSTPTFDGLWEAEQDPEIWGRYWPETAPGFFFAPADLPRPLAAAMYDPAYRVPLYEAVLHDSVVSTERWEIGIDKLPEVEAQRVLLAMLYNEPLMYALDAGVIDAEQDEIARRHEFFAFIQAAAGSAPLTDFRALTDDRRMQQTIFDGGTLVITANFGTAAAQGVDPRCVVAARAEEIRTLCVS